MLASSGFSVHIQKSSISISGKNNIYPLYVLEMTSDMGMLQQELGMRLRSLLKVHWSDPCAELGMGSGVVFVCGAVGLVRGSVEIVCGAVGLVRASVEIVCGAVGNVCGVVRNVHGVVIFVPCVALLLFDPCVVLLLLFESCVMFLLCQSCMVLLLFQSCAVLWGWCIVLWALCTIS